MSENSNNNGNERNPNNRGRQGHGRNNHGGRRPQRDPETTMRNFRGEEMTLTFDETETKDGRRSYFAKVDGGVPVFVAVRWLLAKKAPEPIVAGKELVVRVTFKTRRGGTVGKAFPACGLPLEQVIGTVKFKRVNGEIKGMICGAFVSLTRELPADLLKAIPDNGTAIPWRCRIEEDEYSLVVVPLSQEAQPKEAPLPPVEVKRVPAKRLDDSSSTIGDLLQAKGQDKPALPTEEAAPKLAKPSKWQQAMAELEKLDVDVTADDGAPISTEVAKHMARIAKSRLMPQPADKGKAKSKPTTAPQSISEQMKALLGAITPANNPDNK